MPKSENKKDGKWILAKKQFEENKAGWKKSFFDGFSQDENSAPLPWMTYPFIDFIPSKLNRNTTIFEFGCGSSTLFFAKKVKKYEISIHESVHTIAAICQTDANFFNKFEICH